MTPDFLMYLYMTAILVVTFMLCRRLWIVLTTEPDDIPLRMAAVAMFFAALAIALVTSTVLAGLVWIVRLLL